MQHILHSKSGIKIFLTELNNEFIDLQIEIIYV